MESDETSSVWLCTGHPCSPCSCSSTYVSYEVHPIGLSPGTCDALCTDTAGCRKYIFDYGSRLAALPGAIRSYALAAPQEPGGDEVAKLDLPTGPVSDNRHLTATRARDPWFVDAGGTRLRLFQLETDRMRRDGVPASAQMAVGYEATKGPGAEGTVEFVRPVEATDFTGKAPTSTVLEGIYQVGVRRRPDAAVETYLVRTANALAVTP